jgi:hypothetical protein
MPLLVTLLALLELLLPPLALLVNPLLQVLNHALTAHLEVSVLLKVVCVTTVLF